MSNSYSIDLRERVIAYVAEGGRKVDACRIFKIGHDTLYRWLRLQTSGDLSPKVGRRGPHKLDEEALSAYIFKHPDVTLEEAGLVFSVHASTISRACRRLQITRKKNHPVRGAERRRT